MTNTCMNPQETEALSVIQADRELAASLIADNCRNAIRAGEMDDHWSVQQCARHRIAHTTPGDAEVRKDRDAVERLAAECLQVSKGVGQWIGSDKMPTFSRGDIRQIVQLLEKAGHTITFWKGVADQHAATIDRLATPSGRAQGEVVAWMYERSDGRFFLHPSEPDFEHEDREFHKRKGWTETPLYAAPPAQDQKGEER